MGVPPGLAGGGGGRPHRTGPKVVVVVRLDEMDGNGTSHEYQAYDPPCWSRWSCWWTPPSSVWSGGAPSPPGRHVPDRHHRWDNIICSFDYNLTTNAIYIGDRIYALRSPSGALSS
ncbi:MAG: hypothetical protein ACLT5P_07495 [Flavonifractor plautii]